MIQRTAFTWLAVLVLMLLVRPADAQTKAECIVSHEQTQTLSMQSKLLKAREMAKQCSSEACPGAIQRECVELLAKLQSEIPSVALRMRDADGNDIFDVTVRLNGEVLKTSLDGKPADVDPGAHTFTFEPKNAEAQSRVVMVVPGQRNQIVEVRLEHKTPPPLPSPNPLPQPDRIIVTPEKDDTNYLAVAGWTFAGLSVVSFAVFAGVGATGMSERSDLETCTPLCTDAQVDPVRTKLIVADVFLAVGAVTGAAAVIMLPLAYAGDTTKVQLGPGSLMIRGAF